MAIFRRWKPFLLVIVVWMAGAWLMMPTEQPQRRPFNQVMKGPIQWKKLPENYPVKSIRPLPTGTPATGPIPKIQAQKPEESEEARAIRLKRLAAVRDSFQHSWSGYRQNAWLHDEVKPIDGRPSDPFGGWAATLVDALDSLWIMGMHSEFEDAVKAAQSIDFTKTETATINVFETNIRYLGGFLAAYELSEKKYAGLLNKAVEVGELLMCAFDTPSRMPISRWNIRNYLTGNPQFAPSGIPISEIGSLSLEFTKLSQLTGDMKYYDAVQRISDEFAKSQKKTNLPGMWPVTINADRLLFNQDNLFTLGGKSDSMYEYLPKQYLVLGGALEQPRQMYEAFIDVAKQHLFRRAMNPKNIPIVISGDAKQSVSHGQEAVHTSPRAQHLTCFVAGMVGIGAKIFNRPDDIPLAIQLADGCVWSYDATPSGIGPEIFTFIPCASVGDKDADTKCEWTEEKWLLALKARWREEKKPENVPDDEIRRVAAFKYLPPGMVDVGDRRYILRPEAIEAVFMMYRITGDPEWMEKAWRMFSKIEEHTRTNIAATALHDITEKKPMQLNNMESFWLAETLKYFYLMFSDWDIVDLDKWVLNTEAHPLRIPE